MATTSPQAPIMLRARITRAEFEALRIEAIKRNTTTTDLVGLALRATYNLNGEKP